VRRWAAVAALSLIVIPACSSDARPKTGAVAAYEQQFEYVRRGQWAREWDELHPLQQAFIPRDLFVRCSQHRFAVTNFLGVKVTQTARDRVVIDGTDQVADAIVITADVRTRVERLAADTFTGTYDEVLVGGRWRWTVKGEADAYKRGACPGD
jgi:hypothetical protein